jgi:release factor glutamine methyltransferase
VAEPSEAGGGAQSNREPSEQPLSLPPTTILDLCTGSGCIAIAIAKNLPAANITATDISHEALALAQHNATRHNITTIDFRQADLWQAIAPTDTFDFIVANPPYIPDHEWDDPSMMGANVKGHEPDLALRAGKDGLDLIRPIIEGAAAHLAPSGTLIIETAASNANAALELARAQPALTDQRIINDHEGHPRFLIAHKRA